VIIGDVRLIENKKWTFAKINVNFSTPFTPLKKELIYHHFSPPREEIPLSVNIKLLIYIFILI
jgi:hypothetical protein